MDRASDSGCRCGSGFKWSTFERGNNVGLYVVTGRGLKNVNIHRHSEGRESDELLGDFDCEWAMGKAIQQEIDR